MHPPLIATAIRIVTLMQPSIHAMVSRGKGIDGPADAQLIGNAIVPTKRENIRMRLPFATAWVVVTKVVSDMSGERTSIVKIK